MARYIDADELKDHLIKNRGYVLGPLLHPLLEDVDNQHTADVRENIHGKWIEKEGQDWKYSKEYNCSVCGKYRLVTNPAGWEWNYCPNCGADMRKEQK